MLCIPRIALCGGLIIGVDIIEPKMPPFVIVNVPPVRSSMPIVPALAFSAILPRSASNCAKLI